MQGPNYSHLEQGAARPLPLSSAACREASLRRSWPQQRVVQVIVAPKLGSGESMPDRAGVGAMLGKAHLGDRSHTPEGANVNTELEGGPASHQPADSTTPFSRLNKR